jgi:hypothetical protein
MFKDRITLYQEIEKRRESKLLVYVTGDRPGFETQIHPEILDYFIDHLDRIGKPKKISLLLYTRGGNTLGAWSLVNLIRQFCDDFEVIIPAKAHSAGTLISLGANTIIMTKQATLGPIDPSLNSPLNPQNPLAPQNPTARVPVSVESIKGYFQLAQDDLKINDEENLKDIMINLSNQVHPLVLGFTFGRVCGKKSCQHEANAQVQATKAQVCTLPRLTQNPCYKPFFYLSFVSISSKINSVKVFTSLSIVPFIYCS